MFFFFALIASKRATETHAAYLPWHQILCGSPAEVLHLTLLFNIILQ